MGVSKFVELFHKSLYQVVSKKDIMYTYFFMNLIREKATLNCQLASCHPIAITYEVTLLSKASKECGR